MHLDSKISHLRWMRLALQQAKLAEGRVAENPPVGCVLLDKSGSLVSVGHTQFGGRPHAERSAINLAQTLGVYERLQGGVAYVTLEPCSHTGKTPPCADALIEAGITEVFIAAKDPNPLVSGQGAEMLTHAGMKVHLGLLREEAEQVMCGFLMRQRQMRPFITSKVATSQDKFIAQTPNAATKLTNRISQHYVHDLRARADAIITGVGTLLADNPMLNVRFCGKPEDTPIRLILDSSLKSPLESTIFNFMPEKVIICHTQDAPLSRQQTCDERGIKRLCVPQEGSKINLHALMKILAEWQINHVLLEAGAQLNHSFLSAGLIDRLIWLQAPQTLQTGLAMFGDENKVTSNVDFKLPSRYIKLGEKYFADDNVSIWQK